ncbi:hypothetical protein [Criblamydia sequanensis]|uniref:Uncharacterized protein n=1 Tax=Candidatus Criblamydia sequanensis CRIB-18 TaxID=1437425 RepID=A0A090DXJ2_9BACT|nr:hypothetical protein [Criblamydia sequanensis]CDR33524.1 hypothetical protein CSEC_0691 [Criblamydia sequanensis CRIB-18]
MKQTLSLFHEIEALLDELINNAEALNLVSEHDVSLSDLIKLQEKEIKLIEKLKKVNLDAEKSEEANSQGNTIRLRIKKKLKQFSEFNAKFIKTIEGSHEIIDFKPNESE